MNINKLNYKAMKTSKLLNASLFLLGILISGNILAQVYADGSTQIVRNTSPITYSANNPDGANATFTWNVTGGTIVVGGVDQGLTYNQVGTIATTVSIQVRWNNTLTTAANTGKVTVSKTVGTLNCPSADFVVNVESWVAPNVNTVTTSTPSICSGSAPTIGLELQGCPSGKGFSYDWQVRDASNVVVTSGTGTSTNATIASVPGIGNIDNSTGTNQTYTFVVTSLLDGLSGAAVTSFTASSVNFTVNAVPTIGTINSSTSLTPR
jgi:hypothetical protein